MKKILLLLVVCLINLVALESHAQNNNKTMQDILMSYMWEFYNKDGKSYHLSYSKTTEFVKLEEVGEEVLEVSSEYYLSDVIDPIFVKSKLGKATKGKYLVVNGNAYGTVSERTTENYEIIEISEKRIRIKVINEKLSGYGRINTSIAKPKPNTGWPNLLCSECNKYISTSSISSSTNCKCTPKITLTANTTSPNLGDNYSITTTFVPEEFSTFPVIFEMSKDGSSTWTEVRGFGGPKFDRKAIKSGKWHLRAVLDYNGKKITSPSLTISKVLTKVINKTNML